MKTMTLALVLAAAIGCSKDKAKTTPTPPVDQTAATEQVEPKQLENNEQVSPNLSISPDILAACGITPNKAPAPSFDYDTAELTPEDREVLDKVAACLTTGPLKGKNVALIGRADPRGTEEYNLGLGSRRAQSVFDYLARLGVQRPQLAVSTRGALDATGSDEASWAQDRRVDLTLKQP